MQRSLIGNEMHLKTCAVCDALKTEADIVSGNSRNFFSRCISRLKPDLRMPSKLIKFYDDLITNWS